MARTSVPMEEYADTPWARGKYEVELGTLRDFVLGSGTHGLEVNFTVIYGPEDADGNNHEGESESFTLWYPRSGQKDGGEFCQRLMSRFARAARLEYDRENGFGYEPNTETNEVSGERIFAKLKGEVDEYGEGRLNAEGFAPAE